MSQINVLNSDADYTLIQADPSSCTFSAAAPMGSSVNAPAGALVVNANYYFNDLPLGVLVDQGQRLPFEPLPDAKHRTALVLISGTPQITPPLSRDDEQAAFDSGAWANATIIQAGPRLVTAGVAGVGQDEDFQEDALRRTRQVGIGIDANGQLLFLYVENHNAAKLAQMLADAGAVDAMKVDGGHAAYLAFDTVQCGADNPYTALIVVPAT